MRQKKKMKIQIKIAFVIIFNLFTSCMCVCVWAFRQCCNKNYKFKKIIKNHLAGGHHGCQCQMPGFSLFSLSTAHTTRFQLMQNVLK